MVISSRTPEGYPSRCTLCDLETDIDFSDPAGDATCPNGGYLLWFSAELFLVIRERLARSLFIDPEQITVDSLLSELAADSLEVAEAAMELENEFEVSLENEALFALSLRELIRIIEKRRRGS